MTYKVKKLNLSINRRISVSFRETELKLIYENNLHTAKHLIESLKNSKIHEQKIINQSLQTCLEIYYKCLTYDYIAIL
jgi:hypothetical protein